MAFTRRASIRFHGTVKGSKRPSAAPSTPPRICAFVRRILKACTRGVATGDIESLALMAELVPGAPDPADQQAPTSGPCLVMVTQASRNNGGLWAPLPADSSCQARGGSPAASWSARMACPAPQVSGDRRRPASI